MKGMIMSKRTGRMYGSEEEYLNQVIVPAFERIRRYGRSSGVSDKKVVDRESLFEFIEKVTGHENKGLSREITKTNEYDELVSENRSIERVPSAERERATRVSVNKERAKVEKLVFVGRKKNGQLYAYDFKKSRFASTKKYHI